MSDRTPEHRTAVADWILNGGVDRYNAAMAEINNQRYPSSRSTRPSPSPVSYVEDDGNASERPNAGRETALSKLDQIEDHAAGFHAFMLGPGRCNPDQVRTRAVSALDGIRKVFEGVTDREEPASAWDVEADTHRISEDHEEPAGRVVTGLAMVDACERCTGSKASEEPAGETKPERSCE